MHPVGFGHMPRLENCSGPARFGAMIKKQSLVLVSVLIALGCSKGTSLKSSQPDAAAGGAGGSGGSGGYAGGATGGSSGAAGSFAVGGMTTCHWRGRSGGASAVGGTIASGGKATGGTTGGGGSIATGGSATGGTWAGRNTSTGGSATGGTSTGAHGGTTTATGGSASGGTSSSGNTSTGGSATGGTSTGCTRRHHYGLRRQCDRRCELWWQWGHSDGRPSGHQRSGRRFAGAEPLRTPGRQRHSHHQQRRPEQHLPSLGGG